jgi:tRNA(Ile)-lysidine synthetase-like protein
MDALRTALLDAADRGLMPHGASILLAVSGGADSTALLHATAELAPETRWTLSVAHVHHGWRGRDADRDLAFVAGHAGRLGLPFFHRRRDARGEARLLGLSPEAGARRVRYEALLEMALEAQASRIATAHQRDDRVETHLLARQRKGGLASLAGPREVRADGVVRPLLSVPRCQILDFLNARGIAWRRDRTNGDLSLARNRLRRELVFQREDTEALAYRVEVLARHREELDLAFERNVRPALAFGRNVVIAAAPLLESSPPELARKAILECAMPFARPGRPPFTGREREQIIALLASGRDFRFEAGRRIRFRRRGDRFSVRLAVAEGAKRA